MLSVKFKAADFKKLSELWRLVDKLWIFFKKDGMWISQTTPDKVCGVYVHLRPEAFVDYVVTEKEYTVGIGDTYLKAMGKMVSLRTDLVAGFVEKKGEIVFIVEGGRRKELVFPIFAPDENIIVLRENFEKLYEQLNVAFNYATDELAAQIKEIGLFSKDAYVEFKAIGKSLNISVTEKTWRYGTSSIFEYLDFGQEVKAVYSERLLMDVVKVIKPISKDCIIKFGNRLPLCVEVPLENGFIRFYIAPRVE